MALTWCPEDLRNDGQDAGHSSHQDGHTVHRLAAQSVQQEVRGYVAHRLQQNAEEIVEEDVLSQVGDVEDEGVVNNAQHKPGNAGKGRR